MRNRSNSYVRLNRWTENFMEMAEFSYLTSPSIYNKLLRFVVISWFVRGKIDCGLLQIEIVSDGNIVTNNDLENRLGFKKVIEFKFIKSYFCSLYN